MGLVDRPIGDARTAVGQPRTIETAAFALFGAALWLLSRPFTFGENDGQLYAFMALAKVYPERLGNDLFLQYGSQDGFSIFSPIYAMAIRIAGLPGATIGLLLLGATAWLAASWWLLRAILPSRASGACFIALCGYRVAYAGYGALVLAEGFLTSRIWAESLAIAALALCVRRKWALSVVAALIALALHPLTGLSCALIILVMKASEDRRWWALIPIGALVGLGLGAVGAPMFDRLFQTADAFWIGATKARNGFVFVANWTVADWANLAAQSATVICAALATDGWRRRLMGAVLGSAVAGVAASWIGADLLHNVLITQLQLWRAVWPLAWMSVAAAGLLLTRGRGVHAWAGGAILVASLAVRTSELRIFLALLGLGVQFMGPRLSIIVVRTLVFTAALLAALEIALRLRLVFVQFHSYSAVGAADLYQPRFQSAVVWLVIPLIILLVIKWPRAAVIAGCATLATGVALWDQRTDWIKFQMAGAGAGISVAEPILWGAGAGNSWFLMRSPAYLSLQQASGLLFSRDTAAEWFARLPQTHGLVPNEVWGAGSLIPTCAQTQMRADEKMLSSICFGKRRPGSVVLEAPVPGMTPTKVLRTTSSEGFVCNDTGRLRLVARSNFFFYDCNK